MVNFSNLFKKLYSRRYLLITVFLIGLVGLGAQRYKDVYFEIKKNFTIFSDVFREVSLRYVDEVEPEILVQRAIDSMLESLDPYTVLLDKSKDQQIDMITSGNYAGVGMEVGYRRDEIVVIAPMEGYSAYKKGVRAGDIIKSVDGVPTSELKPEEVQQLMRGDPGTTVDITIERYGMEKVLDITLERERIEVNNVAYSGLIGPDKSVGYILLKRFSQNTAEEIRTAIRELQDSGEMQTLVLDLRNNPGGLLGEAVKTVDKFIEPGIKVVETKGRQSKHSNVMRSEETPILPDMPLIILQNNGSASASEVVAGAIQDLDRGVIMGQRSFGKGLVQIVRSLSYNTALKITTSRYHIPSGRSIQSTTYMHDEQNSSRKVPDSLRKAYETRNGRNVYDGRGIAPDVEMKEGEQSLLEVALLKNSHYFFFANQYYSNNPEMGDSLSRDKLYNQFRGYLEEENFTFQTKTENNLDDLQKNLASSDLDISYQDQISRLEEIIKEEKDKTYRAEKSDIKQELYMEIISRYRGKTGRIEANTKFDPVIQKAIEISHDTTKYRSILGLN